MKKYTTQIIILLFTLNISCVSKKPLADKVSNPDYNQRITVENPQFIKKENTLGLSISIGTTALGGYLAYDYGIIKPTNTENEQMAKVGSGLIGALASYSITRIVTKIAGTNNTSKVDNKTKWLKKLDNNFVFLETTNDKEWLIINTDIEPTFKVKNLADIKDFKKAFPKSNYHEKMLSSSLNVLSRNEIPTVLNLYPETTNKTKYQLRYYELSKNVSELKTAKSLFPESRSKFNICNNISSLLTVSNKSDLDYLVEEYGNRTCRNRIDDALVENCSSVSNCIQLSKQYPLLKKDIALKSVSLPKSVDDCVRLSNTFPSIKNEIGKKAILLAKNINEYKTVASNYQNVATKANENVFLLTEKEASSKYNELNKLFKHKTKLPEESLLLVENFISVYPNSTNMSDAIAWKEKFQELIVLDASIMDMESETLQKRFEYIDKWLEEFRGYNHPNYDTIKTKKETLVSEIDNRLDAILQKPISVKKKYLLIYNKYIKNQESKYYIGRGKEALKKLAQSSISISDNISQILGNKHVSLTKHEDYRVVRPILGSDYVELHTYYSGGYDYETITGYSSSSTIYNKSNVPITVNVTLSAEMKEKIIHGDGAFGGIAATLMNGAVTLFNQNTGNKFVKEMSDGKTITIPKKGKKKIHINIPATDFRDGNLYYRIIKFGDINF